MNILLTGATGFLGSHLLPEVIKRGYGVIILKRSFSDVWRIKDIILQVKSYDIDNVELEKIFQENKVDVILHLATDYGRKNNNDVVQMLKVNLELPARLLDLGVKYGSSYFINAHTSTNSEYTLYSAMKNAFIDIARFFASNYEIKFINIVLEYMYGEMDDSTKFIPFVIESILKGKEIKATEGEQKRDFIYVGDVVDAYIKVLENLGNFDNNFVEFQVGTGKSMPLKEFVDVVEKVVNKKAKIVWGALPYRKNEIFDSKANITFAKELLGWEPKTSLEDGIRKTIEWYKKVLK